MIDVVALEKRFGKVTAVNGVTFTAGDGRVTGLLGPNGAGKTTTLRMLYGVMRPNAGTISVDGIDAATQPLAAQARVGVLPDVYGLYPAPDRARAHPLFRRTAGARQGDAGRAHAGAVRAPGHEAHRRSPGRGLLPRRAHQGGAGARAGAPAAERAAGRADQRPRRDEHARRARDRAQAAGRGALRAVLEPRDAGSVGAVRFDRRRRRRPGRGPRLARRTARSRAGTRTWKMRSWPWRVRPPEGHGDDIPQVLCVRPWWCWSRSSWTRSATGAR